MDFVPPPPHHLQWNYFKRQSLHSPYGPEQQPEQTSWNVTQRHLKTSPFTYILWFPMEMQSVLMTKIIYTHIHRMAFTSAVILFGVFPFTHDESQMWLYSEPSEPLSTKPIIFQRNYSFYHYAAYRSKLNFLFLFSYVVTFFCHRRCSALGLFGVRASFTVNNGFLHKERIQVLPIKWWRYIIALINHGYYEPAGAQCHKTGWKTGSLDFHSSGPGEQYSFPLLPWYHFSSPSEMVVYSCCDISV